MSDIRIDPLSGQLVLINAARQTRPNLPKADECPFCPGGLEAPESYDVHWFVNRWPAMPDDRCEVVLYDPRHEGSLATIGTAGVTRVVRLWSERTQALGARPDIAYVLPFENRGPEVGATIPHPHGQIYAYTEVPPVAARELAAPTCAICEVDPEDRVVARAGQWSAVVPFAAVWPYEVLIAPDEHLADLPAATDSHEQLATVLADAVGRLDRLFQQDMPYLLWVHQRPTDGGHWPTAHVHVHIAPALRDRGTVRFVASAELGAGIFTNPVAPEEAAARLRAAGR